VASAPGRITPHRAPPYEELDLRHEFAHLFSGKSHEKLLPPELHSLTPVCTKSFVGWGFAANPTGGAHSAPPDPVAGFLRGREREEEGREGQSGQRCKKTFKKC